MIKCQAEKIEDIISELEPLIKKHWQEIARHKDLIKLNPDWDKYIELNRSGILHVVTVRNNGELIGYSANLVYANLHYRDHVMAVNDIIYIDSDYRQALNRGRAAIKLLEYTERIFREMGVTKIFITMKIKHDFGNLLERLGYTAIETTYEKLLMGGE